MKKCPYCAEEIQDEAIVCRYCGRDLQPQVEPVKQEVSAPVQAAPVQASAWKQGAKGAAVISVLYVLTLPFTQPIFNPAELMGDLTIGLLATFLAWWIICTFFVWVWRKLGTIPGILKFIFITLCLAAVAGVVIFYSSNSETPAAPMPTRTPFTWPTATKASGFAFNAGSAPTRTKNPCSRWQEIDQSFRGKQTCVYGNVQDQGYTDIGGGQYRIYLGEKGKDFFFVDVNYYYPDVRVGDCVVALGTVETDMSGIPFINLKGNLKTCSP